MANIRFNQIQILHTDLEEKLDNKIIEDNLKGFEMKKSLSRPGNFYDNSIV